MRQNRGAPHTELGRPAAYRSEILHKRAGPRGTHGGHGPTARGNRVGPAPGSGGSSHLVQDAGQDDSDTSQAHRAAGDAGRDEVQRAGHDSFQNLKPSRLSLGAH